MVSIRTPSSFLLFALLAGEGEASLNVNAVVENARRCRFRSAVSAALLRSVWSVRVSDVGFVLGFDMCCSRRLRVGWEARSADLRDAVRDVRRATDFD